MEIEVFDYDRLQEDLFRIIFRIEFKEGGKHWYGTGFFIDAAGHALTSFHNLPEEVVRDPSKRIQANFRRRTLEIRWLLPADGDMEWQQRLDIAVLQGPSDAVAEKDLLKLAFLDPTVQREHRAVFWRARQVALAGYPLRKAFDPELIIGSLSAGEPLQDPKILDDQGRPVSYAFNSLAFGEDFQRGTDDIQGVSGGPLYDCALKAIVGVEFAAWPDRQRVFAAELSSLKDRWPEFCRAAEEFPLPPPPQRGVTGKIGFNSLIEQSTRGFVGREWLAERLDRFFATKERGYFVIEGDTGIGKTAFAGWLAQQRSYVHHFNNASLAVTGLDQFTRNVSARLIERYCPGEAEPNEKQCRDGAFLSELLSKAAGKLKRAERLVIVVDALDEAEQPPFGSPANVLALPTKLDRGVYFVCTTRPLTSLPLHAQEPIEPLAWRADSADNLEDVRRFLHLAARREGMKARLKAAGIMEAKFVDVLLETSEGNHMYLYYVLAAIESGAYPELRIDFLPRGLDGYYGRHWRQMQGGDRDRWIAKLLPVISVLAVAREPLTMEEIVKFVKRGFPEFGSLATREVRDIINEWRPFLAQTMLEHRVCYRIYHDSFRKFLARKDEVGDGLAE